MEKTTEKQSQQINIIRQRFDNVLANHIERLLGSRSGAGGLPLNLLTVSCLIFLAEQNANEKEKFSTPEDRYTHDMLLKELEEIGLGSNTALKEALQEMLQKDYVHISESGFIFGKDPVLKMAKLIDKILPKMPGLNLIAYIAQTIDEAASGRKDIESAVVQFDQTLMQQGVPIRKDRQKPINRLSGKRFDKKSRSRRAPISQEKNEPKSGNLLSATDYDRLYQTISTYEAGSETSTEPRIISSSSGIGKSDIQEISFGAASFNQDESDKGCRIMDTEANSQISDTSGQEKENETIEGSVIENDATTQVDASEIQESQDVDAQFQKSECSEEAVSPSVISESEELIQETDVPASESEVHAPEQPKSNEAGSISSVTEVKCKKDFETEDSPQENYDDIIGSRINSFEENLAMQCPICKSGKIIPEKTMKDKIYYKCLNMACNFISWGKPYHYVCPRCRNPFLIESEKNGKTVLKCPRSTCHYWQGDLKENTSAVSAVRTANRNAGSQKPRRRVVKRRVVRRKK